MKILESFEHLKLINNEFPKISWLIWNRHIIPHITTMGLSKICNCVILCACISGFRELGFTSLSTSWSDMTLLTCFAHICSAHKDDIGEAAFLDDRSTKAVDFHLPSVWFCCWWISGHLYPTYIPVLSWVTFDVWVTAWISTPAYFAPLQVRAWLGGTPLESHTWLLK